jgi:hypothetical protein
VEAVFKRASSGNAVAKIAAHALAGGTLTELQGGKFGHGFISAGFTEALSPAVGMIKGDDFGSIMARSGISAAIGGTASSLSGGSFANGAKTGSFQELFNSSVHLYRRSARQTEHGSNVEMEEQVYSILDRVPESNGAVNMTYGEFAYILSFHADVIDRLNHSVGGIRNMSSDEWSEYLYLHGDSRFYGDHNLGGHGGTRFMIHGAPPGMPTSGVGGDINYFYQGMLQAARGESMNTLNASIWSWNVAQLSPDRYTIRIMWGQVGYNYYLQRPNRSFP